MITATELRRLPGFNGDARLFRLSESVAYGWDDEGTTDHVVVSAVVAPFSGPETYIFASNAKGEIVDWCEMDGSVRGTLDHHAAISNAGWKADR